MTAEQLLTADFRTGTRLETSGMVEIIRTSFALVEPQTDELSRHFYATLFGWRHDGAMPMGRPLIFMAPNDRDC